MLFDIFNGKKLAKAVAFASLLCAFSAQAFADGSIFEGKVSAEAQSSEGTLKAELIDASTGNVVDSSLVASGTTYSLLAPDTGSYYVKLSADGHLNVKTQTVSINDRSTCVNVPETVLYAGDIDRDGKITMTDKLYSYRSHTRGYLSQWLQNVADFNFDGMYDSEDTAFITPNIGREASDIPLGSENIADIRANNYASYSIIAENNLTTVTNKDKTGFMQSGWNYDGRGSAPKNVDDPPYLLYDTSTTEGTAYVRDINAQSQGILTLKTSIAITGNSGNGAGLMFFDRNEEPVYELFTDGGEYCVRLSDGSLKGLCSVKENAHVQVYAVIDLDNGTSRTYLDGVDLGENELAGENPLCGFKFFTSQEASELFLANGPIYAEMNYAIHDDFNFTSGAEPMFWTYSEQQANVTSAVVTGEELVLTSNGSAESQPEVYAYRQAKRAAGEVIFETMQFLSVDADGMNISLTCKEKPIVSVYSQGGALYANGTLVKEKYLSNFWNTIRIEANTDTNTACIKVNGKVVGNVAFSEKVPFIDGVKLSLASNVDAAKAKFDRLRLYQAKEVTDYVPAPVKPADTYGYYVGINVCNLWQNGDHYGWDNITPYLEAKSVLGRYDEDLSESADWQLKFMAEHGVDFQTVCWFAPQPNAPFKEIRAGQGLHDGYFNAKYSDSVDFAILWEAANGSLPTNMDSWKNYFVPYFIEYYLSDDRYACVDGQAVFAIFGTTEGNNWCGFGSVEKLREALEYFEAEVVKQCPRYEGMVFLACAISDDNSAQYTHMRAGFDAFYAYNYTSQGYDANYTWDFLTRQYNATQTFTFESRRFHIVPTVSTGMNMIPWGGIRTPNMTVKDMKWIFNNIKNTSFGSWYKSATGTDEWRKHLMMLSTWNEYGEGTYIMPSNLNGFGYLDAIKSVFTDNNTSCNDVTPTASQLRRVGYLYPQYRQILRPTLNGRSKNVPATNFIADSPLQTKTLVTTAYNSSLSLVDTSQSGFDYSNDAVKFTSTTYDPMIVAKNLSVTASQVTKIVVRAKIPSGSTMQLYFQRSTDSGMSDARSVKVVANTSEMASYTFKVSDNADWNGTITSIRFDPVQSANVTYWVDKFDFMNSNTIVKTVYTANVNLGANITLKDIEIVGQEEAWNLAQFKSTTYDPYITFNNLSLNAADVSVIRVRAYVPKGSTLQLFFTSAGAGFSEAKSVKLISEKTDWHQYCFGVSDNPNWTGTISSIRLDPVDSVCKFYVDKIQFMKPSRTTLFIDGNEYYMDRMYSYSDAKNGNPPSVKTYNSPYVENENLLIPFQPDMSIEHLLKVYYVWRPEEKTFRLRGNGADVTYTMDSNIAVVNGQEVTLTCTPRFNDGLVMFPINHLLSLFGEGFSISSQAVGTDVRYDITTPWSGFYNYTSTASTYKWEFNQVGNLEGINPTNKMFICTTTDGTLKGVARDIGGSTKVYDPAFSLPVSLNPATNSKVVIRMAADTDTNTAIQLFFQGKKDGVYSTIKGQNSVIVNHTTANNGVFVEHTFDFSGNAEYMALDEVTSFRFDPINCAGGFEIDYIRVE